MKKEKGIDNREKIELVLRLIEELKKENIDLNGILASLKKEEIEIPVSVFDNKKLSALETIVKYMKENLEFKFSKISKLLNRDSKTIWVTYSNSREKMRESLKIMPSKKQIPVSVFRNRVFSVLENLVKYLKENYDLTYHEIAELLNRDDRTVWTVYHRAEKKLNLKKLGGMGNQRFPEPPHKKIGGR